MLTEKRYELILKLLDEQNSVTVAEIKEKLKISESTIRRDLNALDKAGKLNKVFGGAVAIEAGITTAEPSVAQKKGVNKEEKQLIARYAAALITKDDFVYLDAGTTTGCMIDFITEKSATYVTNAVSHAQKLAAAGFRVYLIGGELKPTTEAVVGYQAILSLETLHFSKAFFGTNGVSLKAGFSTPDYEEAMVKKTAIGQAKKAYILADYSKFGNISSVTFEEFAKKSKGINRIGVLRADVDNLGQAIVSGFQSKRDGDRYVTLSRTAALSRQLSIFFKYYIRSLLKNGEYSLEGNEGVKERQATIVYSGGDDVFIVGAWNDVIELSVDLQKMFRKYTQGTLSISAGIGIYEDSYPIAAIAQETGAMESESKRMPGKNAVTIMEDGERHLVEEGEEEKEISDGTYSWEEFDQEVIQEKYRALSEFFEDLEDRGMAFLYRMLELVRGHEEKINFARMMYLLSRLEPSEEGPKKEKYRQLSKKMYEWIQSDQDCRQLKTAINLYAYMNRKGEGKDED